ncbi:hypothetical protein NDU88_001634 [Pleurodeles waltl]|uniref:Uncharacterized protein n=1 Tax=Pleurodeles waltl TaxID=8319 RepID=A0AAV7VBL1_PLEWA|nr:hypothetical protein NDU88_001634 [Pleurodeles waltl]
MADQQHYKSALGPSISILDYPAAPGARSRRNGHRGLRDEDRGVKNEKIKSLRSCHSGAREFTLQWLREGEPFIDCAVVSGEGMEIELLSYCWQRASQYQYPDYTRAVQLQRQSFAGIKRKLKELVSSQVEGPPCGMLPFLSVSRSSEGLVEAE